MKSVNNPEKPPNMFNRKIIELYSKFKGRNLLVANWVEREYTTSERFSWLKDVRDGTVKSGKDVRTNETGTIIKRKKWTVGLRSLFRLINHQFARLLNLGNVARITGFVGFLVLNFAAGNIMGSGWSLVKEFCNESWSEMQKYKN